jgi:hypothetical protein
MPMKRRCVIPMLAATAVAAGVAGAPLAAADIGEVCTNLNTGNTKCERPGNAEVNASLTRANTTSMWAGQGGSSGGPYGGTLGGGNR